MRLKKFLAFTLAATMVMSPVTAFAADLTEPGGTDTPIDITGSTQYVDTVKYVVTLPTATGLDFKLDPQGTFGYFSDDANSSKDSVAAGTDLASYAGKIVGVGKQSVVNKSSVPIVVTCKFTLSTDAKSVNIITDQTTTINDNGNDVRLNIVGGSVDEDGKFTAGTYKTAVGTTATEATMALGAADYEFKKGADAATVTYEPKAQADGVTTEVCGYFSIAGDVSKSGDWTEIKANALKLSCVYSFAGATDISEATVTDGFVTADGDKIKLIETTPAVPEPTAAVGYFDDEWNLWIAIKNDEEDGGISDSDKLTSVMVGDTDPELKHPAATTDYKIDTDYNWLMFTWDQLADYVTDGDDYSFTISFTYDGTDYIRTVTQSSVGSENATK